MIMIQHWPLEAGAEREVCGMVSENRARRRTRRHRKYHYGYDRIVNNNDGSFAHFFTEIRQRRRIPDQCIKFASIA